MKVIVNGRTTELIDTQGDFKLFFEEVSNQFDFRHNTR